MKDGFKNNIGLKVMAVFFAIFLWWTVVNVDDPIETKKFAAEVMVTNPEVITNTGKSYQIIDNTKNVTVTVKARRKVISEIRTSNIVATADLREMQGTSVPIRIRVEGFEGSYVEATANPRNIQVQTEDIQKKTFQITTVASGNVRNGYVVGNMVAEPHTVDISGPKSLIGRIYKVVARVDVSELMEDTEIKAELTYYDSADNIIDKKLLSSNCDKNGVSVKVTLWKTKSIGVKFDTSGIKPAAGYAFEGIEVAPQTIEVAGERSVLDATTKIEIGAEALRKDGITENEEVVVDITEYLPKGMILVDEDNSNVVVRIILEKAGTKSILLPVRSIQINHLAEDLELAYGPEQEIELLVEGTREALQSLTSEQIIASIDLKEYTREGTYEVPVQITGLPEQCHYIEGETVQVVLTKK